MTNVRIYIIIVGAGDWLDIDELKNIRNFIFRINADIPLLREAVEKRLQS